MINKIFAVYDSKALAYLQPFFSQSNGAAIRAFEDAVNDGTSPIAKHPGDYQLYEIGSVDDSSALLSVVTPVKLLCNGLDFVKIPQRLDWKKIPEGELEAINNGKEKVG